MSKLKMGDGVDEEGWLKYDDEEGEGSERRAGAEEARAKDVPVVRLPTSESDAGTLAVRRWVDVLPWRGTS